MNRSRNCIATKGWLALLLLCWSAWSWAAQVAGTVVNLSGPLLAKKADGTVKVLSQKSAVEQGDTLVTEKDTYARIRFTDNSEVTLKPNTQFKVEAFDFDEDKPAGDKAEFSLVKGGLRAVTGALGKRSKDKVGFNTPTATIGIRGTIFIAEYVAPDEQAVAAYALASVAAMTPMTMTDAGSSQAVPIQPLQLAQNVPPQSPGGLAPGLYVQVIDGMIHVTNSGGSVNFAAGQFGFTPSLVQPPVIVPSNPGLQFTPPPAFSASNTTAGSNNGKSSNVDCEVR
jgi:hypothetical protein